MDSESIGRYIRTLDERCSFCNTMLQERGKNDESVDEGVVILIEKSYKYCYTCNTQVKFEPKAHDWRKKNARNIKRIGIKESARRSDRKRSGRYSR